MWLEQAAGLVARVGENKKDDFPKTTSEKSQKTKKRFNYGIWARLVLTHWTVCGIV